VSVPSRARSRLTARSSRKLSQSGCATQGSTRARSRHCALRLRISMSWAYQLVELGAPRVSGGRSIDHDGEVSSTASLHARVGRRAQARKARVRGCRTTKGMTYFGVGPPVVFMTLHDGPDAAVRRRSRSRRRSSRRAYLADLHRTSPSCPTARRGARRPSPSGRRRRADHRLSSTCCCGRSPAGINRSDPLYVRHRADERFRGTQGDGRLEPVRRNDGTRDAGQHRRDPPRGSRRDGSRGAARPVFPMPVGSP